MKRKPGELSTHVHCALYAAIALVTVLMHGGRPIDGVSSKLTILLMCGFILAESAVRAVRIIRKKPE